MASRYLSTSSVAFSDLQNGFEQWKVGVAGENLVFSNYFKNDGLVPNLGANDKIRPIVKSTSTYITTRPKLARLGSFSGAQKSPWKISDVLRSDLLPDQFRYGDGNNPKLFKTTHDGLQGTTAYLIRTGFVGGSSTLVSPSILTISNGRVSLPFQNSNFTSLWTTNGSKEVFDAVYIQHDLGGLAIVSLEGLGILYAGSPASSTWSFSNAIQILGASWPTILGGKKYFTLGHFKHDYQPNGTMEFGYYNFSTTQYRIFGVQYYISGGGTNFEIHYTFSGSSWTTVTATKPTWLSSDANAYAFTSLKQLRNQMFLILSGTYIAVYVNTVEGSDTWSRDTSLEDIVNNVLNRDIYNGIQCNYIGFNQYLNSSLASFTVPRSGAEGNLYLLCGRYGDAGPGYVWKNLTTSSSTASAFNTYVILSEAHTMPYYSGWISENAVCQNTGTSWLSGIGTQNANAINYNFGYAQSKGIWYDRRIGRFYHCLEDGFIRYTDGNDLHFGRGGTAADLSPYAKQLREYGQNFTSNGNWVEDMSNDGATVIVGGGNDVVTIFTSTGTIWSPTATLRAGLPIGFPGNGFGNDGSSLSGDGGTAFTADYGYSTGGTSSGAVFVFERYVRGFEFQRSTIPLDIESSNTEEYGRSVAMNSSGTYAIVGAPVDDGGLLNAGTAYIYTRQTNKWSTSGSWVLQTRLEASDRAVSDNFGYSVAINDDGDVAVVGAYAHDTGGVSNAGAAYIFHRTGEEWQEAAKVFASNAGVSDLETNAKFGSVVSISGDGRNIMVGAPDYNLFGTDRGACYMWVNQGTQANPIWIFNGRFTPSVIPNDNAKFGSSIAMSTTASYIAIGAPFQTVSTSSDGAVYIFVNNSGYQQQAVISASDPQANSEFGRSIAMTSDGANVIIGRPRSDSDVGSLYWFSRSGTTWSQTQKFRHTNTQTWHLVGNFQNLSISKTGDIVVAGLDGFSSNPGDTAVFNKINSLYTQTQLLSGGGESVAISGDGAYVVAGQFSRTIDNTNFAGLVDFYGPTQVDYWRLTNTLLPNIRVNGAQFGYRTALDFNGTTAIVGAPASWKIHIFHKSGSTWTEVFSYTLQTLGGNVDISDDGNTAVALAPAYNTSGLTGVVAIFYRNGGTWSVWGGGTPHTGAAGNGWGLSLSGDGMTMAVGAYGTSDQGKVSIWRRRHLSTNWSKIQEITQIPGQSPVTSGYFGAKVRLSQQGDYLAISEVGRESNRGALYTFTRSYDTFTYERTLYSINSYINGFYGNGLAMSAHGHKIAASTKFSSNVGHMDVYTSIVGGGGYWNDPKGPLTARVEPASMSIQPGASVYSFTNFTDKIPVTYEWFVNGVSEATTYDFQRSFSSQGTYNVTLVTSNIFNTSTFTSIVSVGGPPTANFSASPLSGAPPLTVYFTDSSTGGATSWFWDFTNNGSDDSSVQNPSYTYNSDGVYSVRLRAENAFGSNEITKTNYITVTTPTPVANFSGTPRQFTMAFGADYIVNFTDLSTNTPTSWAWDFTNNGSTDSTSQNPSFNYNQNPYGFYTVKLAVTNAGGSDEEIKTNYIELRPSTIKAYGFVLGGGAGGGGGAGSEGGGGGGAGGIVGIGYTQGYSFVEDDLYPGETYVIVVGGGGGGGGANTNGSNGGTSEFYPLSGDPGRRRYAAYGGGGGASIGTGNNAPTGSPFNTLTGFGGGGGGGRSGGGGSGGVSGQGGGNGAGAVGYWSGGGGGGGSAGGIAGGMNGEAGETFTGYPNGGDGGWGNRIDDLSRYDSQMPAYINESQPNFKTLYANGVFYVGMGGGGGSGGGAGAVSGNARAGRNANSAIQANHPWGNGASNYLNITANQGQINQGGGGGGGWGGASETGRPAASEGGSGGSGVVMVKFDKKIWDHFNVSYTNAYRYDRTTYTALYFHATGSLSFTYKY